MRKLLLTVSLLLTIGTCYADADKNHADENIQAFEKDCHIALGRKQLANIVSSKVGVITSSEWGGYRDFEIILNIKLQKKVVRILLSASCYEKEKTKLAMVAAPLVSLRGLIASEDSGGRYFRHVAWEREIKGGNWRGDIVYLDYVFGDGQRSNLQEFIIRRADPSEQIFHLHIDSDRKLNRKERQAVFDLIRDFNYLPSAPSAY